jgi:hypothetical protein
MILTMMKTWSGNRVQADIVALEQSVERARLALACSFSSYDEFEADVIQKRRQSGAFESRFASAFQLVLGTTAGACIVALVIFAL